MPHDHDLPPLTPLLQAAGRLALDPASCALLVVDLQYFDAHRDFGEGRTAQDLGVAASFEPYFARIDAILPRAAALLDAFRGRGAEVVHVRVAERTRDARDVAPKQLLRGLIVPSDSQEAAFLPEVAPLDDELRFSKSSSGMFPATDADRIFRNLGIRTLVFAGTSTSGCVESAVRDALDLGYRVLVVEDACAASTGADHRLALQRLRGPACRIVTTREVLEALSVAPACDRRATSGIERVKPYLPKRQGAPDPGVDPYDLIFPPPQRVTPTRGDTAVLVLDAQLLASDPQGRPLQRAREADPNHSQDAYLARVAVALASAERIASAARAAGVLVVHVASGGRTASGRDLSPTLLALMGPLPPQHPGLAPDPRLTRAPEDLVISKPAQGPFTGTGLDDTLRLLGVRNLIVVGLSVVGAVESALRGATDRGYGVLLVPEACAAPTAADQARLARMGAGLIEVVSLAEALARLAQASADAAATPA
jgi:nicotinamidase-related amidase